MGGVALRAGGRPTPERLAAPGLRVLMLLENNAYPADTRVRAEAEALAAAGFQVTVISPRRKDQGKAETLGGVAVRRYRAPNVGRGVAGFLLEYSYAMVATFLLTVKVSLRPGFDVIHAHNPPDTFVLIGALYKLLGKRFVFDHHDLTPEMYRARFPSGPRVVVPLLMGLERLTFRLADHVISTNESYRRIALERGRVPSERVTVVRNGPDLDRVKLVEPDPELGRRADFLIAYVGVMGVQDGIDYLLRALRHLIDDVGREDFFCVLVGDGDARPALMNAARDLDLDERVRFTGRVPRADLLACLSAADVCVDPDPSNPFNDRCTMIKMMEYMALAKPIVAFDLPEHRVTAGEAAAYARPNDELDFARQIALLLDDPARRAEMGRLGRRRVEDHLAWPHQEANLLHAYGKLAGGPRQEGNLAGEATAR